MGRAEINGKRDVSKRLLVPTPAAYPRLTTRLGECLVVNSMVSLSCSWMIGAPFLRHLG